MLYEVITVYYFWDGQPIEWDAIKANFHPKRAIELGVDPAETVTCYQPDAEGRACGACDACRIRKAGFADAQIADPTSYNFV